MSKAIASVAVLALTTAVASGALASRATQLVAPSAAQRAAILRAFGDPGAPGRCLGVGLAASNHAYATVRFHHVRGCGRWGFNGENVLHRGRSGRWKVIFEASSYNCPQPGIPRQVQRDLGICP